jgi:hypothetical protein
MKRRIMIVFLVLVLLSAPLSGCARENTTSQSTATSISVIVNGKIELPANSALKPKELKIVTCVSTESVSSDGSYSAKEAGNGPALAFVTNAAGVPILMGFVQSSGSSENKVNALSTAVALLFQALPAYTLPRDTWPSLIVLLEKHPATIELANTITERFAADNNLLAEPDANMLQAIQNAADQILASAAPSMNSNGSIGKVQPKAISDATFNIVATTSTNNTPAQVTVEPSGEVNGILVTPNANGNGIIITNNLRRHLWAYLYRTGWKSKDDDESEPPRIIDPWEPVIPSGVYIQAVKGFSSTLGTLVDYVSNRLPYLPIKSDIIILPVAPDDAVRTYYQIIVVGPSWAKGDFDSDLPLEYAGRTAEAAVWKQAEEKMDSLTFYQEFLFPAILTVFPAEAINNVVDSKIAGQIAIEMTKLISGTFPKIIEQISSHDYRGALLTFLKAFDNKMLRDALIEKMLEAGWIKGGVSFTAATFLNHLNVYIATIDKFLKAGDLGLVVAELSSAKRFTAWSATAAKSYIRIQNDPSLVVAGLDVTMTCYGTAGISGVKEYEWKTSGIYGHLEDTHGNSGTFFTSSDQSVRYVADENDQDGDEDFVSVTARLKENGQKKDLGYAEADVVVTDTPRNMTFVPATPSVSPNQSIQLKSSILPSLPAGVKVEVEWTCTNQAGTLTSTDGKNTPFTAENAKYTAGDVNGEDKITATAWRLTLTGKRVRICMSTVSIRVGTTQIVTHTHAGMDFVLLIFSQVEGASHYYVTYRTHGYDFPEVPDTWPANVRKQWNDYYQGMFANIDGKRQEIQALFPGSPYVDPKYAYNPDYPLQPGEAYWIIFQYPSEKMEDFAKPFFHEARDNIMKWTADIVVE